MRNFKHALVFVLIFTAPALAQNNGGSINGKRLLDHVEYLASDALKGRRTGEAGNEAAQKYITAFFKKQNAPQIQGALLVTTVLFGEVW